MTLQDCQKLNIELSSLSIVKLRGIDIQNQNEERIVSEEIKKKLSKLPPKKVKTDDITRQINAELKITPEIEAKYQKILDERATKIKNVFLPEPVSAEEVSLNPTEVVVETPSEVVVESSLTEDIDVVDKVISKNNAANFKFCDTCDSKGVKHKKNCPKAKYKVWTKNGPA